jgi:hypothetical protein
LTFYGELKSNSKEIFYATRYFDQVLFYDSSGKLLKEYYFSKLNKPILSRNFSGVDDESPIFFKNAYGTEDFCYFLRLGWKGTDLFERKYHPTNVLVFNWNGDLVKVHDLNSCPFLFCVDNDNTTLFGLFNNGTSEEFIKLIKFQL